MGLDVTVARILTRQSLRRTPMRPQKSGLPGFRQAGQPGGSVRRTAADERKVTG